MLLSILSLIENHLLEIIVTIVGSLITFLVGLIVWIAKDMIKKLEEVKESSLESKVNINNLIEDFKSIKENIKEFPKMETEIQVLKEKVSNLEKNYDIIINDFKRVLTNIENNTKKN